MKKLVLVVVAVVLVAAVVVAGCGKKSDAPTSAQGILDKSQQASQDVKSLKANGSADVLTPDSEVKESKTTFQMEGNIISETDVEAKIVATDQSGEKTEAYVMDGYAYSYSPTTGWVKQKVDSAAELGGGMMTPGQLTNLSKYAENLEKLPDEGNNYVISFDVGSKFFEEALEGADFTSSSSPSSEEEQNAQAMVELAKQMLAGLKMNIVMKIDKTTYLPSETAVKMSLKDAPMLGDMTVDMTMNFSDYDQPVTVSLPPEAQNAQEMPSTAGGIPSIPGLGI
jgi:outer membrane murein-binding lipoprotein Lpp